MKKIVSIFLLLSGCFGPTITSIGPLNITVTDLVTAPSKIQKLNDWNSKNEKTYDNFY